MRSVPFGSEGGRVGRGTDERGVEKGWEYSFVFLASLSRSFSWMIRFCVWVGRGGRRKGGLNRRENVTLFHSTRHTTNVEPANKTEMPFSHQNLLHSAVRQPLSSTRKCPTVPRICPIQTSVSQKISPPISPKVSNQNDHIPFNNSYSIVNPFHWTF